jgi:hypothetical protein
MIPLERGLKGLSIFIIFYLPIFVLFEKSIYKSFLGKGHMVLDFQCKYINPSSAMFEGSSPFTFSLFHSILHSRFLISFLFLVLDMGTNL